MECFVKLAIVFLIVHYAFGEEIICTINTKRAINKVSDKFLSVSIDPAVLLTGLNLSNKSLQLARHLSPAYIRVAGPTTRYVKYSVAGDRYRPSSYDSAASVEVSPSMWFGINEWLALAKLTPIFGLNDAPTTNGVWNPKATLPLLELSDRLNATCLWQLGFDCSNKTELQYKGDLVLLQQILEAFPSKKNIWKIVASDLSRCSALNGADSIRATLDDLQGVAQAAMWEPATSDELDFPNVDTMTSLLVSPDKPPLDIWTTAPKPEKPASFATALTWMKQMSEAAKQGYTVIFRQFRLHEMFSESPAYWASLLYKNLMGRNVLEVRTSITASEIYVYAHCTKNQDDFPRRGAMTVLIVNNSTEEHSVQLRLGGSATHTKTMEVQSYVLTAPYDASPQVYLNDVKLTTSVFKGTRTNFVPRLRRAKVSKYLSLWVPPKSIGFFVIPGARNPVCMSEENEISQILQVIQHDQTLPIFEENKVSIEPRITTTHRTLREMQRAIQKELESDERYYQEHTTASVNRYDDGGDRYTRKSGKKINDIRNYYMNERPKERPSYDRRTENKPKTVDLELTSAEIRKVLADRARAKAAAKNIVFTSEELQELMHKASETFLDKPSGSTKPRRKFKRQIDPQAHIELQKKLGKDTQYRNIRDRLLDSNIARNRNITRIEGLRDTLRSSLANRRTSTPRSRLSARLTTDTRQPGSRPRLLSNINTEPRVRPTFRPIERPERLRPLGNQDELRRPLINLRNNQAGNSKRTSSLIPQTRQGSTRTLGMPTTQPFRQNPSQLNHEHLREPFRVENRLDDVLHEQGNRNHPLSGLQPNHQENVLHSSAFSTHQIHPQGPLFPNHNQHHPSQVNIHVNLHPVPGHPNVRPGLPGYDQSNLHKVRQRQANLRNLNGRLTTRDQFQQHALDNLQRYRRDINMDLLMSKTSETNQRPTQFVQSRFQDGEGKTRDKLQKHKPTKFQRNRRDINMELLKTKTGGLPKSSKRFLQSRFRDRETKDATLRKSDETSDELLNNFEDEEKKSEFSHFPTGNVFAQLASSSNEESHVKDDNVDKFNADVFGIKHKSLVPRLFTKSKPLISEPKFLPVQPHTDLKLFPKFESDLGEIKTIQKSRKEIEVPEPLQFLTDRDGFDSALEHDEWNPYHIHEFNMNMESKRNNGPKLDMFDFPARGAFPPSLQNRGFSFLGQKRKKDEEFDFSREFMKHNDYDDLDSDERPLRFRRSDGTDNESPNQDPKKKTFRFKKLELTTRKPRKERTRSKIVTLSSRQKDISGSNMTQDPLTADDTPINKQSFHIVIGNPLKANEKKIDDRAKERQFAILRSRLAYRKKLEDKKKNREGEKVKQDVIEGEHNIEKRSLEYDNNIIKRYEPVVVIRKPWKPDDMKLLRNKEMFLTNVIKREPVDDTAIFKKYFQGMKRSRRGVDKDVDVGGNKIDGAVNDIIKESDIPVEFRRNQELKYNEEYPKKNTATIKPGERSNSIKKGTVDGSMYSPEEINDTSEMLLQMKPHTVQLPKAAAESGTKFEQTTLRQDVKDLNEQEVKTDTVASLTEGMLYEKTSEGEITDEVTTIDDETQSNYTDNGITDSETTTPENETGNREEGTSTTMTFNSYTEGVNDDHNVAHDTTTTTDITISERYGEEDDDSQVYPMDTEEENIVGHDRESLWDKVVSSIAGFFQMFGAKLASYLP